MNASKILAIAAFAATASVGAHAGTIVGELGDAQPSYTVAPYQATTDRADVAASAALGNLTVGESDIGGVYAQPAAATSRAAVHAQAVQAERVGDIVRGES